VRFAFSSIATQGERARQGVIHSPKWVYQMQHCRTNSEMAGHSECLFLRKRRSAPSMPLDCEIRRHSAVPLGQWPSSGERSLVHAIGRTLSKLAESLHNKVCAQQLLNVDDAAGFSSGPASAGSCGNKNGYVCGVNAPRPVYFYAGHLGIRASWYLSSPVDEEPNFTVDALGDREADVLRTLFEMPTCVTAQEA